MRSPVCRHVPPGSSWQRWCASASVGRCRSGRRSRVWARGSCRRRRGAGRAPCTEAFLASTRLAAGRWQEQKGEHVIILKKQKLIANIKGKKQKVFYLTRCASLQGYQNSQKQGSNSSCSELQHFYFLGKHFRAEWWLQILGFTSNEYYKLLLPVIINKRS